MSEIYEKNTIKNPQIPTIYAFLLKNKNNGVIDIIKHDNFTRTESYLYLQDLPVIFKIIFFIILFEFK